MGVWAEEKEGGEEGGRDEGREGACAYLAGDSPLLEQGHDEVLLCVVGAVTSR